MSTLLVLHPKRDHYIGIRRSMNHSQSSDTTSSSLLDRVKANDQEAWQRLVDLYGPLVYFWCRRASLAAEDSADIVQETFRAVSGGMADFCKEQQGDTFRGWLRTIALNKMRDHLRSTVNRPEATGGSQAHQQILQVADSISQADISYNGPFQGVLRRLLEQIQYEFQETTWQAFWRTTVEDQYPADVALDLNVSVDSVYQAKSRVLRRLRRELNELGES